MASPGIVIGWSGVGAGKLCAWPTVGWKVMSPTVVDVLLWKPESSWKAVDLEWIASMLSEPTPLEASVRWAIEWVDVRGRDAVTHRGPGTRPDSRQRAQARNRGVRHVVGLVAAGQVGAADVLVDVVLDPAGTCPPLMRVPNPVLWKANDVLRWGAAPAKPGRRGKGQPDAERGDGDPRRGVRGFMGGLLSSEG